MKSPSKQPPPQIVVSEPEAPPRDQSFPAQDDASTCDAEPTIIEFLEEKLGPIMLKQEQVRATITRQHMYIASIRAKRWHEAEGKAWPGGPRARDAWYAGDTRSAEMSALDAETHRLAEGIRKEMVEKDLDETCFLPLTKDVKRVEDILSYVANTVAQHWEKAPEGEVKDCMNVVYELCVALHQRIGFNHKLAEGPLHEQLVKRFAEKLRDKVWSRPDLWLL